MISDEAVEAAASVLAFRGFPKAPQPYLNKLWFQMSDDDEEIEVDGDLRLKRGRDSFREEARAALEAALPHLIASQGCGTGHSGEQLEPAVGATAALARPLRDGMDLVGRRASKDADAYAEALRNVNKMRDDGSLPDGGEAVHSPAEREGSRDEPKNDLAHPQKGGEG